MMYFFLSAVLAMPSNDAIQAAIKQYNQDAFFKLPTLNSNQIATLQSGAVLSLIDDSAGAGQPRRAIGMILSDQSHRDLWLACQDPHFAQQSSTTELRTHLYADQSADWYGFLDLPWPFSNRHWLVKVWNNAELAQKNNNLYWEHPWKLKKDAQNEILPFIAEGKLPNITEDMVQEAIYTPVNHGAWALVNIGDHNLLIYHATTIIGGNIPDDAAVHFTQSTLGSMLSNIDKRAEGTIQKHYTGDHYSIIGGDNQPIPLY